MNGLKQMRTAIGLTQVQISNYLGVPRTVWSMAEAGKRDLPTQVLLNLNEIDLFLRDHTQALNEAVIMLVQTNEEAVKKAIGIEISKLEHESQTLLKQINQFDEQYAKAQLRLGWIHYQLAKPNTTPKATLWLEILEIEAMEVLKPTKAVTQMKLKIDKMTLDFKIEKMKEMII